MKFALITVLPAAALLTACAGSPVHLSGLTVAELWNVQAGPLCNAYFHNRTSANVQQVLREKVIVYPENWADVSAGRVRIGYTEDELVCARGAPTKVNESVSSAGVRRQWVYRGYGDTTYFYTDGRRVTGWN